MSVLLILSIIFIHWVADFVAQTNKQACGKSSDFDLLIEHTFTYTCIWVVPIFIYGIIFTIPLVLLWFLPITFACHTVTDFYTSRINKQLWEYKEKTNGSAHNFFISIGFDQVLHYIQLFLTLKYLVNVG